MGTTFKIKYRDRPAGTIKFQPVPKLGDGTLQIAELRMNDEYGTLDIINKIVRGLWKSFPEINRFVIEPTDQSKLFWEKLGFQRLNNTYWMSNRGH